MRRLSSIAEFQSACLRTCLRRPSKKVHLKSYTSAWGGHFNLLRFTMITSSRKAVRGWETT